MAVEGSGEDVTPCGTGQGWACGLRPGRHSPARVYLKHFLSGPPRSALPSSPRGFLNSVFSPFRHYFRYSRHITLNTPEGLMGLLGRKEHLQKSSCIELSLKLGASYG